MERITLKQRTRETWQKLLHLNASPHQIAAGVSLGVFVSFLPIIPLRTIVALGLAWLFRQNVIAALAGKSITLLYSPAVPLIWLAEYRLGKRFILVEHAAKFDRVHLGEILHMGWDVFTAMLVGAVIIATPVSLITYAVVKQIAERRLQRNK
jgi:uncharacterized protein (DUF2062 family)